MASRTMSAVVGITVCFFLLCNANTMTAEVTPTPDHSVALLNTENSLNSSPETPPAVDEINSTFSNTSTTTLNTSTQFSPSTTAATTQITVNVSGSSTLQANETSTSTSLSSSTVPPTGSSASSNNQIYSTTTSGVTRAPSTPPPTQGKSTSQNNGTETTSNDTTTPVVSDSEKNSMHYSEIILTSIFSCILVIVVLVILLFGVKRCMIRSQYSHHPLRETSYEPADGYLPPDDTLVISGGLYDAPRIYNPNMTVLEEEEPQNDNASFNSRPGQFRLEFLPGDKDLDPVFNGSQRRNV